MPSDGDTHKNPNGALPAPPALNAQDIARRAHGTLFFYWLGEKQSYLWAVTAQKTSLFTLPPGTEIDAAVERYRKALGDPGDVLASGNQDGRWLYQTLIAPARGVLDKCSAAPAFVGVPRRHRTRVGCPFDKLTAGSRDSQQDAGATSAKVFIIPDRSLNNLNLETLLVPGPKPHFWIEDATITSASSLRVLAASRAITPGVAGKKSARNLLLVGDTVAPSKEYPELPKAAAQMESVAKHFPEGQRKIFSREHATPAAYLGSQPGQFSYIHFVTHGTASRLSPLDSAIILSKDGAGSDSFKLYARDVIQHPLHADLVTVSACYGAAGRSYSGEGLVGLSWAFVRAGAHHVIAALWEATDASTQQLMDRFYDELDQGASPDVALRAAKLSLLRGGSFRNPFYWAPFQLYAGS